MQMNRWFVIRASLIIAVAVEGLRSGMNYGPNSDIDWQACWVVSAATLVGTFIGLTFLHRTRNPSIPWVRPSWFENPFQPRTQPLQLWDFSGLSGIAAGVGGAVKIISSGAYDELPAPCLCLFMGFGIWIAVQTWMLVFLRRSRGQSSSG